MRKIVLFFLSLFYITSCDDGDVFTVAFNFDDTFKACGELVFYKTKDDPAESLSLQITSPSLTLNDILETDGNGNLITTETSVDIGGANPFNYRSYNINPSALFCNDVPPASIIITNDVFSLSGTATITTSLTEDDNDGIPADLEDLNLDGDNDPATDPTDTDNDSIPDYLDADDDGDNVLTATEILDENLDGDNDPLTNPLDTDNDGIPNYLDIDDDNDGVNTIDEENVSQDENPNNDFTNPEMADYLNDQVNTSVPATAYRPHTISQSFNVRLVVFNLQLPTINQTEFDFGTLSDSNTSNSRTITPEF